MECCYPKQGFVSSKTNKVSQWHSD